MINKNKKQGLTLIELLIVIIVIGVLAALIMMASDEAVSSARAAAIINNLTELKTAVNSWYASNFHRIDPDGRVRYDELKGKVSDTVHPVQEWSDLVLHFSKHFSNKVPINVNLGVQGANRATNLEKGYYGVYDAGGTNRRTWYVGYSFKEGEDKVKEKLNLRAGSLGLFLLRSQDPDDITNTSNQNKNADFYENKKLKNPKDAQSVWIYAGIGPALELK